MSQNLKQQTQNQGEKAKSCMKLQNEKEIEHNRQNVIKFQTRPKNKNYQNFVLLNKRKNVEKFGGKMLEYVKEFGSKGFIFYY